MISKQNIVIGVVFLASLITWQWLDHADPYSLLPQKANISLPSFSAQNITSWRYTPDGQLTDIFSAKTARYYDYNQITDADYPVLKTFNNKQVYAWNLTATSGQMYGTDRLILRNNIVIKNHDPSVDVDTLKTSYLEMDLKTRKIQTDSPVTIDSPNYHDEGVGIRADLNTKIYTLLEKSHATYYHPR